MRFITIDLILSTFELIMNEPSEEFLATCKQTSLNLLMQIEELSGDEEIALYDLFKEQWRFMQKYEASREREVKKALNDTNLLLDVYADPRLRVSELLRSLKFPKARMQDCVRSYIRLGQALSLPAYSLHEEGLNDFPLKEEPELAAPENFPLDMTHRIVACQQFMSDILIDLYSVYLSIGSLLKIKNGLYY